jgi:hypothetical protein
MGLPRVNASRLSVRAAATDLLLRDDDAQMEGPIVRIGIVSDASTFREDLVELDPHIPTNGTAAPDDETRRRDSSIR